MPKSKRALEDNIDHWIFGQTIKLQDKPSSIYNYFRPLDIQQPTPGPILRSENGLMVTFAYIDQSRAEIFFDSESVASYIIEGFSRRHKI